MRPEQPERLGLVALSLGRRAVAVSVRGLMSLAAMDLAKRCRNPHVVLWWLEPYGSSGSARAAAIRTGRTRHC